MYILYMCWCREYLQGTGYTRKHEILNNAQHNLALYPPARLGALPRPTTSVGCFCRVAS